MTSVDWVYDQAKYWAPVIGAAAFFWKVVVWLKQIRENDLNHFETIIKISLKKFENALSKQTQVIVDELKSLRSDFNEQAKTANKSAASAAKQLRQTALATNKRHSAASALVKDGK